MSFLESESAYFKIHDGGFSTLTHGETSPHTVYSKPADIYAATSETLSTLAKIPATLPTLTCQVVQMRNNELKDFWDAQYQKYDETCNAEKREREG